ncbi:PHP domain-containing protein [bacterium]|nr:PHP domain-containing protein [candidate division CSSED10-310 bacterium]
MCFDFHIHSNFSDGQHSLETIAEHAVETGLQAIAFSDHYFTRKTRSIKPDQLPVYLETISKLREKYRKELIIKSALELDMLDWILTGKELSALPADPSIDFFLCEYVTNESLSGMPLKIFLKFRSAISKPVGLAHTDLPIAFAGIPANELMAIFAEFNIFVELNEGYCRPGDTVPFYRHWDPYFHQALSHPVSFSAGTDMHSDLTILGAHSAYRYLESKGIRNHLIFLHEIDPDRSSLHND